jgi:spore maturation protein CgeE
VEDVDVEYARLQKMGVDVIDPPTVRPWGAKNMSFRDPDGNLVIFRSFPRRLTISDELHRCEIAYARNFCEAIEEGDVIRFTDENLLDMYYHNFSLLQGGETDDEIVGRVEREIERRAGKGFCNIVSHVPIHEGLLERFAKKPDVSLNGFYQFDNARLAEMRVREGCVVARVADDAMVDELIRQDLIHDGATLGEDFCTRRINRKRPIYLAAGGLDAYLCYDNGEAVGNCELFIGDGVAKIENFTVLPDKQRKGYGTTILKTLIGIALERGVTTVYLVTDEEDTAKEMYLKIGFDKVGEGKDLFFQL